MSATHLPTLQYLIAEFLVSFAAHVLQLILTFKDPEPFVGTVVEHDGF